MRVILTEPVEKLGQPGEVKEVANGYARNFLFPRNMAIPATKGALLEASNRRASAEKRAASQINAAHTAVNALDGLTVLLYARTGEQNRLYGSITPADIAEALRVQHNQKVDRRRIKIDSTIHRTGNYSATVTMGHNLAAKLKLTIEPEANRTGPLTSVAAKAPAPPAPPTPPVVPEAAAPLGSEAPVEAAVVGMDAAPVEAAAPVVEAAPVEAAAPVVDAAPVEAAAIAPVVETAPVEAAAPDEVAAAVPVVDTAPDEVVDAAPAEIVDTAPDEIAAAAPETFTFVPADMAGGDAAVAEDVSPLAGDTGPAADEELV